MLEWQVQHFLIWPGEGEDGSAKNSWAIGSLTNASDCGRVVRAYSHEVKPSVSVMQPYHYDRVENRISFAVVKKPCPSPRGSDNVGSERGSATSGESMGMEIDADENSTAETRVGVGVACFLGSHAEESVSRTSAVVAVVTVSAIMHGDGAERAAAALHVERGFYSVSPAGSCPPPPFSSDHCPLFPA